MDLVSGKKAPGPVTASHGKTDLAGPSKGFRIANKRAAPATDWRHGSRIFRELVAKKDESVILRAPWHQVLVPRDRFPSFKWKCLYPTISVELCAEGKR